ncbi:UvrD-helicase domain-containing protein [Pedobacter gandavensis]|uniref:UvrD-helicase domain-containing protein n=1 Tax=Pedobacter gandavensis TaxID=2679963 RepID=UPI00292D6EC6|nr:UvrD-helicase domain-containing protein [Pedobacter gandavensis]
MIEGLMAKNFNTFNGKSPYIDYFAFEKGIQSGMPNCANAEVFVFNNFPVDVSTEMGVDFLLVIAVEDISRNYHQIIQSNRRVYLHNLILPVKVVPNWEAAEIVVEDGFFKAGNEVLDYSEELTALGYGMRDYLGDKCGFIKEKVFVHPLVFVVNKTLGATEGHLMAETFSFEAFLYYLKCCGQDIFISYAPWRNTGGFSLITQDVKRIIDQASRDSKTGFITQKKIDRISKEISASHDIFEELGKRMVIIEGKAGTGKTSEILLLMMRCIDFGQNTLFLTFNKLLVFDIARTLKSYISQREYQKDHIRGEHSVMNLHRYMHKLSRSIGLLHLMSESRILEVGKLLDDRVVIVGQFIKDFLTKKETPTMDYKIINPLKTAFQNSGLERGVIEVGIDVANYINKKAAYDVSNIDGTLRNFAGYKKELLSKIEGDKIFLADYYKVLENTLVAIRNPDEYFEKYNIGDKFELLSLAMNLSDKHKEEDGLKINQEAFLSSMNQRVSRRKRRRTLFIDEAQDCHPFERELLLSIFGVKNIVVSSGGYEQLIRHVELCNWNFFNNRKLIGSPNRKRNQKKTVLEVENQFSIFSPEDFSVNMAAEEEADLAMDQVTWYKKGRKSYRVKKSILDFCNYFAQRCHISLGLQAVESEDQGEIIFDFRPNPSEQQIKIEIDKLLKDADLNGCTPYEGLLMLIDANAKTDEIGGTGFLKSPTINEYGNIEDSYFKPKRLWKHSETLQEDIMLWDGAVEDKNGLGLPAPYESRLIYYESCRGLEAWSVACFSLDRFFSSKLEHPDAEKYLIEEERKKAMQGLEITNEDRKMMFAGTWALMALTRAMDKVYIGIDKRESELGKLVMEYIKTNPKNVRVIN